jgi:hypothetical protein
MPTKPDDRDVERATWYLFRAHDVFSKSVAPLNELSFLYVMQGQFEKAAPLLEASLQLQTDQQRGRYLMAIVEHTRGVKKLSQKTNVLDAAPHFAKSVDLLTEALERCTRWQASPEPSRYRRVMLYNRACGRARLAECPNQSDKGKLEADALADLLLVFPEGQEPEEQRLSDLRNDSKDGGDFFQLRTSGSVRGQVNAIIARVLPDS